MSTYLASLVENDDVPPLQRRPQGFSQQHMHAEDMFLNSFTSANLQDMDAVLPAVTFEY